jgi:glycosyltransferase involved in cell wall biosynthesis
MPDTSLSILLPVHSTRYLSQSLKSIYESRGLSNAWELIVILDRVPRQEFENANPARNVNINIHVVDSESPGIVSALNLGLKICKGKYIARIDEDDLVYPNRFMKQLKYLETHPGTVAVGGSLTLIDQNGLKIGMKAYPIMDASIRKRMYDRSPMAHPGAMILASAIREVDGYRMGVPEDWDLWLRLSRIGKIHNLHRPVIAYRQHPDQLSKTSLYKSANARKLIFLSEFKTEQELISISKSSDLIDASFYEIGKNSFHQKKHERVNRFQDFEHLRISRSESMGQAARLIAIRIAMKYPIFSLMDLITSVREKIYGLSFTKTFWIQKQDD